MPFLFATPKLRPALSQSLYISTKEKTLRIATPELSSERQGDYGGGRGEPACMVWSFSGCPQNVFMKSLVRLQNREDNLSYCEMWKQEITLVRADYYHHIPVPA